MCACVYNTIWLEAKSWHLRGSAGPEWAKLVWCNKWTAPMFCQVVVGLPTNGGDYEFHRLVLFKIFRKFRNSRIYCKWNSEHQFYFEKFFLFNRNLTTTGWLWFKKQLLGPLIIKLGFSFLPENWLFYMVKSKYFYVIQLIYLSHWQAHHGRISSGRIQTSWTDQLDGPDGRTSWMDKINLSVCALS